MFSTESGVVQGMETAVSEAAYVKRSGGAKIVLCIVTVPCVKNMLIAPQQGHVFAKTIIMETSAFSIVIQLHAMQEERVDRMAHVHA